MFQIIVSSDTFVIRKRIKAESNENAEPETLEVIDNKIRLTKEQMENLYLVDSDGKMSKIFSKRKTLAIC